MYFVQLSPNKNLTTIIDGGMLSLHRQRTGGQNTSQAWIRGYATCCEEIESCRSKEFDTLKCGGGSTKRWRFCQRDELLQPRFNFMICISFFIFIGWTNCSSNKYMLELQTYTKIDIGEITKDCNNFYGWQLQIGMVKVVDIICHLCWCIFII